MYDVCGVALHLVGVMCLAVWVTDRLQQQHMQVLVPPVALTQPAALQQQLCVLLRLFFLCSWLPVTVATKQAQSNHTHLGAAAASHLHCW
jgi:hypothetical protein